MERIKTYVVVILFIISISCFTVIGFFVGGAVLGHEEPAKEVSVQKVDIKETVTKEETQEKDKYVEKEIILPVKQYISIIYTTKGKDVYIDRLNKAKKYLSVELYNKLSPNMTKEEIDKIRDNESDISCKVDNMKFAIRRLSNGYQVFALYDYITSIDDKTNPAKYLLIVNVKKKKGRYIINQIKEQCSIRETYKG